MGLVFKNTEGKKGKSRCILYSCPIPKAIQKGNGSMTNNIFLFFFENHLPHIKINHTFAPALKEKQYLM